MRQRRLAPILASILVLGAGLAPLRAQGAAVAAPQAPDYAALIGPFPQPGSDAAKADLAILLWLQQSRTPDQVRRTQAEVAMPLALFSEVTGKDLASPAFARTRALADDMQMAIRQATGGLKRHFARVRPYLAHPEIQPAIALESSYSYPSGHSSWGMAQATLLAMLEPQRREAILERGRLVGYDRALGGVHYPSDVRAGQLLGSTCAQAWLAEPAQQKRLAEARGEW